MRALEAQSEVSNPKVISPLTNQRFSSPQLLDLSPTTRLIPRCQETFDPQACRDRTSRRCTTP